MLNQILDLPKTLNGWGPKIKDNVIHGRSRPKILNDDLLRQLYISISSDPEKVFFIDAHTGKKTTGADLLRDVRAVSLNLVTSLKMKADDVVVAIAENKLELVILLLACWCQGIVFAPLNFLYTRDEMLHILNIIKPNWLFCGEKQLPQVRKLKNEIAGVEAIVTLSGPPEDYAYEELLKDPGEDFPFVWAVPVALDSVAALLCSSGTTGLPKCVELTHTNFQNLVTNVVCFYQTVGPHAVVVLFLPLYHIFGILITLEGLVQKKTCVVIGRFEFLHFLKTIEMYKINEIYLVPPVMVSLAKHPMVEKVNLSSVQVLRYGAAPIRQELVDTVKDRIPSVELCQQIYGMTELTGAATLSPVFTVAPPNSVGLVTPGACVKVTDPDTDKPLGPQEEGEICFKGVLVMKGYRNNREATEAMIDKDGWLHTGDLGYYDDQGWIFVKERLKEIIKYNCMQVSPTELETLLLQHPAVKDVAVWGLPDDSAGELPMAFVVLQNDVITSAEEIQKFVADRVSPIKKLRGGVKFVDSIPKSTSGKILRRKLKDLLTSK